MKKTIFIMAVLCIGLVGSAQALTVDLVAGQNMVVGTVEVTKNLDGDLLVKFMVDTDCEDVLLTETHVHVGEDLGDFPITKKTGNPKIGNFDYGMKHDPAVSEYTYEIPADNLPDEPFLVAAHAVTGTDFCSTDELPEVVAGDIDWDQSLGTYFKITISGDGALDGAHGAWCADIDLSYTPDPTNFTVDPIVPAEIDCLLNNDYVGKTAEDGYAFTIGDVQLAIWIILEDLDDLAELKSLYPGYAETLLAWFGPTGTPDNTASQAAHVAEILEDVDGCDMIPGCCDVMGILLNPEPEPDGLGGYIYHQPVLIQIPAPCCQTAWGDGEDGLRFSTTSWATYFWFPSEPI